MFVTFYLDFDQQDFLAYMVSLEFVNIVWLINVVRYSKHYFLRK